MTTSAIPLSAMRGRRALVIALVAALFGAGIALMLESLKPAGATFLSVTVLIVFAILFLQLSFGFTLAALGYWVLGKGGDPFRISEMRGDSEMPLPATAILIPIYNEDVPRVFAGLRLMYASLLRTGRADAFDFFILSDSNDPNYWIEEEKAWLNLCKELNAFGRIFYRKRRVTLNHKSGNIADFCRRWGAQYRYMIVADADSIMTGELMVRLTQSMEANPGVGIIQTSPRLVLGQSLFRRMQQFSSWLYGPLFSAGANFWHLGGGNYWGHNAILRMAPFVKFCALPELNGAGPLKGRILSHDTVEAALMRRAGYEVWLAYDLEGSYEEAPPHLPAMLARDRRWCQGNMQHLFVLMWPGLRFASRLHISQGILAYGSAPLWGLFMVLTLAQLALSPPAGHSGFPAAPILFAYTLGLLFVPKLLGVLYFFKSPARAAVPGLRVGGSVLWEMLFSTLLAPVQMFFFTKFVFCSLTGIPVGWKAQDRGEQTLSWKEALQTHWSNTAAGLLASALIWRLSPPLLAWASPVLLGLILAPALARFTSSPERGDKARKKGFFLVPEECRAPAELAALAEVAEAPKPKFFEAREYAPHYGILQAVLDPAVHSIHVSLLRLREQLSEKKDAYLADLGLKLLAKGPASLTVEERSVLLWEPETLMILHKQLWFAPPGRLAAWWENALRHYNEQSAMMARRSASSSIAS